MKFLTCALLILIVTVNGKETDVEKEKRGTETKTAQPSDEQSSVAYSSAKVTQQTHLPSKAQPVQYVHQPQVMYVPQTFYKYAPIPAQAQVAYAPTTQQYEQPVQYIQQTVTKAAQQPSLAKLAYAQLPSATPVQYSSAADVSSFSYSSPLVAYNNLGLLSQAVGKLASQPVRVAAHPQQSQPIQLAIKAAPQVQHQPQQQVQYVQAPVQVPSAPQQIYYAPTKSAATIPSGAQPQYIIASPQQQYSFVAPKSVIPQYTILPQSLTYNIPQQQQLQAIQSLQHLQPQQVQYEQPAAEPVTKVKEVHEPKVKQSSDAYQQESYPVQQVAYAAQQKSGVSYA